MSTREPIQPAVPQQRGAGQRGGSAEHLQARSGLRIPAPPTPAQHLNMMDAHNEQRREQRNPPNPEAPDAD